MYHSKICQLRYMSVDAEILLRKGRQGRRPARFPFQRVVEEFAAVIFFPHDALASTEDGFSIAAALSSGTVFTGRFNIPAERFWTHRQFPSSFFTAILIIAHFPLGFHPRWPGHQYHKGGEHQKRHRRRRGKGKKLWDRLRTGGKDLLGPGPNLHQHGGQDPR